MTIPLRRPHVERGTEAEAECLGRLRHGDEQAFEALYHAHAVPLARVAYRYVRSAAVAEELAQDVLLRLWEHRASLDIRTTLGAYLHAALRHRALDYLKAARTTSRSEHAETLPSPPLIPSDELERRELATALRQAIDALPDRCRQAFTLRWDAHLSYAEIADVMGISIKAVERQRAHALDALRRALNGRWP